MWLDSKTVIYQIFIDRFALPKGSTIVPQDTQPVFCGGSIRGIIEHFDHIANLGVTAIWLSPFYKGESYHGYHPTDLYSVDSRFGTETELKELIDLAHRNNIKIIADFVPNHVSNKHPFFIDAQTNPKSQYRDWFTFSFWPNHYTSFLGHHELPKLNLDNLDARAHVIGAAEKWLDMGFDGFRLDHIPGPSDSFWKAFFGVLTTKYKDKVYIGEAWLDGVTLLHLKTINTPNKLMTWLRGTPYLMHHYLEFFPSVLDFEFNALARTYAQGNMSRDDFVQKITTHAAEAFKYKTPTFLDNHDMDRIMYLTIDNPEKVKEIVRIQFSLPLPVVIYQGSEFAMTQDKSIHQYKENGDLAVRKMIPWQKGDGMLYEFYREMIRKKRAGEI